MKPDLTDNTPTTDGMTRRAALTSLGAIGVAALAAPTLGQTPAERAHGLSAEQMGWDPEKGEYVLPPLPYAYDALEPYIDARTMEIHHDKHHAGYVRGLNSSLANLAAIRAGEGDPSLVQHWTQKLAFHGSGHVNHTIFWLTMAPEGSGGGGTPSGALADAINRDFGSFDKFSAQFKGAAGSVEGSGWAWLVYEHIAGRLLILQAENQQKMASMGVMPLLGVDVWEHAYYLKYQNRRADYVKAFMNVINWDRVGGLYSMASAAR
jgi:Fe-Mn family superoxide dismutase